MWSFYALAVMFSLSFIQSIVMFGKVSSVPVSGVHKAISLVLMVLIAFVFWDFFEPTKIQIGAILFALVILRAFLNFVRYLPKSSITTKYGYWNFFNSLSYLIIIIIYQVYK